MSLPGFVRLAYELDTHEHPAVKRHKANYMQPILEVD